MRTTYAIYDATGKVVGFSTGSSAPNPPDGGGVLEIDSMPDPGLWVVTSGALASGTPTLAQNKATKTDVASAHYDAIIRAGYP